MTASVRATLGLGSNLGDRKRTLERSVEWLADEPGITVREVSPFVETAPDGGPAQPDFVNAVVVIETTLTPRELLEVALRCEQRADRVRGERWGPRTLDVDILAFDDIELDEPDLQIPHPRALKRAFVLVPWAAVEPDRVVMGQTVSEWSRSIDRSGIGEDVSG